MKLKIDLLQMLLRTHAELIKGTGIIPILNSAGLTIASPRNAFESIPLITRARYVMKVI